MELYTMFQSILNLVEAALILWIVELVLNIVSKITKL